MSALVPVTAAEDGYTLPNLEDPTEDPVYLYTGGSSDTGHVNVFFVLVSGYLVRHPDAVQLNLLFLGTSRGSVFSWGDWLRGSSCVTAPLHDFAHEATTPRSPLRHINSIYPYSSWFGRCTVLPVATAANFAATASSGRHTFCAAY
jgi:hypothetical protein